MQGNLAEIMPLGLLQTLAMGKKTGKLIVEHGNEHLEVFFNDGVVVHAASRQGDGELGILELFILNDGNYIFIPDERTTERTVSRPINSIITECMALVDKHQFLTKAGLKMSSYLTRTNLSLTESDFDGLTKNAPCPNRELLKAFFQQIDQHSRFFELLRKFPISKLDWLPILYALVTTNLIEISDKPSQAARLADLGSLGIDMTVVRDAYNSILRPETGVMGFPLFLHFLEQEYYRFETSRIPFTLLVLDVSLKDSKTLHALPEQAVRNLAQLIEQEKRKIDILGHFQKYEFAMILPATGVAGGLVFANKLQEVISESTICGAGPETAVSCFCGIAALPEDSSKVELLLPAALEAKKNAHETGKAVVAFKNLYQSG
jgi:diguanylate cyclase (GGDEF)-like protein